MNVKERILTIRLIEKLSANPIRGEVFGTVIVGGPAQPHLQTASKT